MAVIVYLMVRCLYAEQEYDLRRILVTPAAWSRKEKKKGRLYSKVGKSGSRIFFRLPTPKIPLRKYQVGSRKFEI